MRKKLIYTSLTLCFAVLVFMLMNNAETKKELLPESPITQQAVKGELVPPKNQIYTSLGKQRYTQTQNLEEMDIVKTMQGEVTLIDWCMQTAFVDDVPLDMGSLNLVGIINVGDQVKLTYIEKENGKVIQSIYVLR